MTQLQAIRLITGAKSADDLGPHSYKDLAKLVHPDVDGKATKEQKQEAFLKLGKLVNSKADPAPAVTLGDWIVESPLAKGDIADLYSVTGNGQSAVLKVSRSADDNDLMKREVKALKAIRRVKGADEFLRYFPDPISSFEVDGRSATVLSKSDTGVSLGEIVKLLPGRVPWRHIVWMMNRGLTALGLAHRQGIIHGAVTPDHLLYMPECHGLMLVDWCCSVNTGLPDIQHIPMVIDRWDYHYPPEVKRKQDSYGTDIYMLACAMMFAAEHPFPRPLAPLLEWMLIKSPSSRPDDAWRVQEDWKAAAETVFGPPKWVDFVLPKQ